MLLRARLALEEGDAEQAIADADVALFDGIRPPEESGLPEILAVTDPACGYAWGEAEGRQLRGGALLLQAAQRLGRGDFAPARFAELPKNVRGLVDDARKELETCRRLRQKIQDPKVAETEDVLAKLDGGVLTRHPSDELTASGEENMSDEALKIYFKKLAYFRADLAKTADTKQRFSIEQEIDEIKAKIVELGGQVPMPTRHAAGSVGHTSPHVDATPVAAPPRPTEDAVDLTQDFDVFLSYNRSEKAAAIELGRLLEARGLAVWLDYWEIAPGRPRQEALEKIIQTTRSAAVLVGKDGLGPWNDRAMRACLSQFVDRGLPVIPVLMPGVPEKPGLPPFLALMKWTDLRGGLTEEGLDRLQWGITGIKPGRSRPTASRPTASRPEVSRPVAQPAPSVVSSPQEPRDGCRILFLAANPTADSLALDVEVREIEAKIRASDYRKTLKLISKWAVRPDDLLQLLNEHKPHIVHFSGHGYPSEEIVLQDSNGQPKPVSKRALAALFTTLKDNIRLVVLNACYSKPQAAAIVDVVDCAVGMNQEIGDQAAITFSASFYRAIGFGRSVKDAFDQGNTALLLEGIPEEETAELMLRDGVHGSEVVLVSPS